MKDCKVIIKLLRLFKVHVVKIIIIVFLVVVSSIISVVMPLISRNLMDNGLLSQNYEVILFSALSIFFIVLLDNILNMLKETIRTKLKAEISLKLNKDAFSHIKNISISELQKTHSTELLNNLINDIGNMSLLADSTFFLSITQLFNIIGGIIGLIIINWKLTFVVVLFIPLKYIITKKLTTIKKKLFSSYMIANSDLAKWFDDSINGINEIKMFGIFHNKLDEFTIKQKAVIDLDKKMTIQMSLNLSFDKILLQLISSILYIVGAKMVFNIDLTLGSLLTFITYSIYVMNPLSALFNIGLILSSIIPSSERYYDFLSMKVECDEAEGKASVTPEMIEYPLIEFRDVSFSYTSEPVLRNINFDMKKGEKIAIIGSNGSGKTTVINLLLRFYKPSNGEILINSTNINDIDIDEYRKNMAVVSQDNHLFNDTIGNNISLYKCIHQDDLINYLQDCNLYDFYKSLPQDYLIGPNGSFLSGGQRQKIAFARALATKKNIIILDEATSNIDIETEEQINELIATKFKDKLVIIISHRPNILRYMDKIIILKDGIIHETGKHDELLAKSELYRDILTISK